MMRPTLKTLALFAAFTLSPALAAPFLGSKDSFMASAFCKAHSCKHVATVPTTVAGTYEQFHYDVDKKYRVVVWRITSDKSKITPQNTSPAGQVRAVGIEWYGLQETPFGAETFVAQLMAFATGKSTTAATALKLMGEGPERATVGGFQVFREDRVLPGVNAGWMSVTAMLDPFN